MALWYVLPRYDQMTAFCLLDARAYLVLLVWPTTLLPAAVPAALAGHHRIHAPAEKAFFRPSAVLITRYRLLNA